MSTPQHTPGPWKVIETHYLAHDGDHVADMSNGLMVVPCFAGLGDPLADARLIAAAPELLEALRGALKALDAIGDEMTVGERYTNAGQYLLDSLAPARAAIAKATGSAA